MEKKCLKTLLVLLSLAALAVFGFSCKVGLGDAVDTMVPEMVITSPADDAKITYDENDAIKVAGTWVDDTGLDNLTFSIVTTRDLSTTVDGSYYSARQERTAATADGSDGIYTNVSEGNVTLFSGTWQVSIPKGKLNDGNYKIIVTGYDSSKHKVELTRLITIDSTPPIFLLSKPASTNIDSPSSYGRSLKITGNIYDISDVVQMKVYAYDATTFEPIALCKDTFDTFETINTSVTVAEWTNDEIADTSSDAYKLRENYRILYGDAESGDRLFYLAVELTDAAGNTCKSSRIESFLLSAFRNDSIVKQKIDSTDLRKIIDGSYQGDLTEEQLAQVRKIFNDYAVGKSSESADEESKLLAAKINKDADPTYKVRGFKVTANTSDGNVSYKYPTSTYISNETHTTTTMTFTLDVVAGRDGTKINPTAITGMGFYPVSSSIKTYSDILTAFQALDTVEKKKAFFENAGGLWAGQDKITDDNGYALSSATVSRADVEQDSFTVTIGEGLKMRSSYIIIVGGADVEGNPLLPAEKKTDKTATTWYAGYGVLAVPENTQPPTIATTFKNNTVMNHMNFASINNAETSDDDSLDPNYTFWGTVTSATPINYDKSYFTITIVNENDSNDSYGTETSSAKTPLRFESGAGMCEGESYPANFVEDKSYKWYLPEIETFVSSMGSIGANEVLAKIRSDHTLIADEVTAQAVPGITADSSVDENSTAEFFTPLNFTNGETGGATYLITINLHFENQGDGFSETSRSFTVDTKAPSVSFGEIDPVVTQNSTKKVNGKIRLNATANDTHLSASSVPEMIVWGKTKTAGVDGSSYDKPLAVGNNGTVYSFKSDNVDTTIFEDDSNLYFAYAATDTAGNKWIVSNNQDYVAFINNNPQNRLYGIGANFVDKQYVVDQSTDMPVLNLSNADKEITDVAKFHAAYSDDNYNESVNLFNTTTNRILLGTITDDDGVAGVSVYCRPAGSSEWALLYEPTITNVSPTYSLSVTLPQNEGEYEVKINVVDSLKESASCSSENIIVLAVDKGAPEITEILPSNGQYFSSTTPVSVSANIREGSGKPVYITLNHSKKLNGEPSDIEDDEVKSNTYNSTEVEKNLSGTTLAFTDSILIKDGANGVFTASYKVRDFYRQESNITISYLVDNDDPTNEFYGLNGTDISDNLYLKHDNIYTYRGTSSDAVSGIAEVLYFFGDYVNATEDTPATPTESVSLKKRVEDSSEYFDWTALVQLVTPGTTTPLSEGQYKITFRAVDGSGRHADISRNIYVDTASPVLSFSATPENAMFDSNFAKLGDSSSAHAIEKDKTYYANGQFTLTVDVTETYFDLSLCTLKVNGEAADWTSKDAENKRLVFTQNVNADTHANDGTYTYQISVTDKAGRNTTENITVVVDTTVPTVNIEEPSDDESVESGTTRVIATIEDNGAGAGKAGTLSSLNYAIVASDVTTASGTESSFSGRWVKADLNLGDTEGAAVLTLTVKDNIGNQTVAVRNFSFDKAAPTITEDVLKNSVITNKNVVLGGTARDSNGIDSIYIIDNDDTEHPIATIDAGGSKNYTWSYTFDVAERGDGEHRISIVAKDNAGRKSLGTLSRTISVDTVAPVLQQTHISFKGRENGNVTLYSDSDSIGAIDFNSSDSSYSDVSTVYYKALYSSAEAPSTPDSIGNDWNALAKSGTWKSNVFASDLNSGADGSWKVYVVAVDTAGNISAPVAYSGTIIVDRYKPSVAVNAVNGNTYTGGTITSDGSDVVLTLNIQDTNVVGTDSLVGSVAVIITKDSDSSKTVTVNTASNFGGSGKDRSAKVTVPFSSAANIMADGTYTITVQVTDANARTSEAVSYPAMRDQTPPVLIITAPSDDYTYTGVNNYEFRGKASDDNLDTVTATLYKNSIADENKVAGYTNIALSPAQDASWTWKVYDLEDTLYLIQVVATDKVNQKTTRDTSANLLVVDTTAPRTSFAVSSVAEKFFDSSFTELTGDALNSLSATVTYYTTGNFTLGGTITEANFQSASLSVSKDGADASALSFKTGGTASGAWTYEQAVNASTHENDGTYVYTLTLADKAGNQTTSRITIVVDTLAPEVEITSPANGDSFTLNTISLKGSHSDEGSGTKTISYSITGQNPLSETLNATGGSWKFDNVDLTSGKGNEDKKEGLFTLTVTAVDNLGNSATTAEVTFTYDVAKPTLSVTSPEAKTTSENKNFTFTGTASDSNELESLTISFEPDTEKAAGGTSKTFSVTPDSNGNWTKTFSVTDSTSADYIANHPSYTVRITATDIANKSTEELFYLTVDNVPPTVDTRAITTAKTPLDGKDWYATSQLTLEVTASDTTSGVSSVKYIVNSDSNDPTDNSWIPLVYNSTKYTGTVNTASQGLNTIKIAAIDAAGNTSGIKDLSPYVDTDAPEMTVTAPATGAMISKNVDLNFSITIADKGDVGTSASGIPETDAQRTVTLGGESPTSMSFDKDTGTLSGTFAADTIGKLGENTTSTQLVITAHDSVGNPATESRTLNVDNEAPIINISNPANGAKINGAISINGTSSDNSGVSYVYLYSNNLPFTNEDIIAAKDDENSYLYNLKFRYDKDNVHPAQWSEAIGDLEYKTKLTWTKALHDANVLDDFYSDQACTVALSSNPEVGTTVYLKSRFYFIKTITSPSTYNWKFAEPLDTAKFGDGTSFKGLAVAEDLAGNKGYATISLTVDQDADRPIIKFNNVKLNGMLAGSPVLLKATSLYGTVTDDDGVRELYVSSDGGTNWGDNLYSSGSWEYLVAEGENNLMFKVIDGVGKEFISSSSSGDLPNAPKLIDTEGTKFGYRNETTHAYDTNTDTKVYIKVDNSDPELLTVYWFSSNEELASSAFSDSDSSSDKYVSYEPANGTLWKRNSSDDRLSAQTFGGSEKRYIYLLVAAEDVNGISAISGSLGSKAGTGLYNGENLTAGNTKRKIVVLRFDANGITDTNVTLSYKATDNAERTKDDKINVTIDNAGPEIKITSHKDGANLFGTQENIIFGSADDIASLYFKLTTSDTAPTSGWSENIGEYTSPYSWFINFGGEGLNNRGGTNYYTTNLKEAYKTLYTDQVENGDVKAGAPSKDIFLWLYGVDQLGNASEPVKRKLSVNPHGDIPSVTVTYPTENEKVGGTLRMTGTTGILTGSVVQVFVQIDPSYGFHSVTWSDALAASEAKTEILDESGNGTGKYSYANYYVGSSASSAHVTTDTAAGTVVYTADNTLAFNEDWATELTAAIGSKVPGYTITNDTTKYPNLAKIPGGKAILANGTQNWNLTVNKVKELEGNGNMDIAIRVFAVGSSDKINGEGTVVPFVIDANTPLIGSADKGALKLVKRTGDLRDGAILKEQPYEADMWIDGIWYLTGSIYDDSGLKEVLWDGKNILPGNADGYNYLVQDGAAIGGCYNYTLNIPVGSTASGAGSFSYKLHITENTTNELYAENTISIKYDNEDPVFASTTANKEKIQQSNGSIYTFSGTVTEDGNQSGFERVAMYITRSIGGIQYVVDPMLSSGTDGKSNCFAVSTTGLEHHTTSDGMYWRRYEETSIDGTTITLKNTDTVHDNVRKGGLCKINDVVYRIESVDYTNRQITVDTDLGVLNDKTVYFAIAQVIDHLANESNFKTTVFDKVNSLPVTTSDDGDQMLEAVNKSGQIWSWEAGIDSSLILDGAITVHFVAYDKAGNIATYSYNATVSNNQPRIAGVQFGMDTDGNGTVSDDELLTGFSGIYGTRTVSGKNVAAGYDDDGYTKIDELTVGSKTESKLTVKGALRLVPEIVGGNQGISYNYSVTDASGTSIASDTTLVELSDAHSSGDTVRTNLSDITMDVATMLNKDITDGQHRKFSFVLWDNTEGLTAGTNSQSATIHLWMDVALRDSTAPTITIDPFYWNGKNDNSLFGASTANGHIELGEDLPGGTFNVANAKASGLYDNDPKVSGMIVLTGTANDNQVLQTLTLAVPGLSDSITLGTYDAVNGTWDNAYDENNPVTSIPDSGYVARVKTLSFDNDTGHTAQWWLYINTAKISGVAATDVKVTANASDKGLVSASESTLTYTPNATSNAPASWTSASNTSVTREDDGSLTTNKGAYYKMDVVPYITKISTRLDDAYSAVTSVFNRSANGSYPVMRGEEGFKLYGFNLNGASTTVKFNSTSVGTVTAGATSDYVTFTVPNTAKSGAIDVTVNSVASLNNSNSTTAEYNLEPNGINNDILNDNRSVYVWGMNDVLTGTFRYPIFKVGKDANQTLVWSYDQGGTSTYLRKGNTSYTVGYSWTQWYDTNVAIDTSGNLFGLAQNGDSAVINSVKPKDCSSLFFYPFVNDNRNVFTYTRVGTTCYTYEEDYAFAWENTANNTVFNPNRIRNQKLVAVRGTNNTQIYSVYYDATDSAIKFRAGTSNGSNNASANINNYSNGRNGSATGAQVIESGNNAGEYASVGIIPTGLTGQTGGTAVVCWYSGNTLKFKYNTSPLNSATWSDEIVIDADYAGEYCNLAVDAAGGIHIAYYRAGNKLKYAYLESYTDTTPDVCMVDSYLSVGENISIETSSNTISYKVGNDTKTRYVPYISYYSSAIGLAKVAWPVSLGTNESSGNTNTFVNGVATDKFTGAWEVQVLPTALSTKLLNYTIGVGEKTNGSANSVMLGYGTKDGLQTALLY